MVQAAISVDNKLNGQNIYILYTFSVSSVLNLSREN